MEINPKSLSLASAFRAVDLDRIPVMQQMFLIDGQHCPWLLARRTSALYTAMPWGPSC
jgi:hypothetical protein